MFNLFKMYKMFIIFKIFMIFKKFKRFDQFKKLRPDKFLAPMNWSQTQTQRWERLQQSVAIQVIITVR